MVAATPGQHCQLLQDDGDADGGDQRRQAGRVAQRPIGDALDSEAEQHANHGRRDKADQHHQGSRQAAARERLDDRQ